MTEARHDSLYERLRKAGKLDAVFRALYDGEKDPKTMARWLKDEGIPTSRSAVFNLVKMHGWAWRHDQFREAKATHGLPADDAAAAAEILRQKVRILTLECDSLKEVRVLAQITNDAEKLAQAERLVKVAEEKLALAVYEAQHAAAAELNEILENAARLQAEQRARQDDKAAGLSDAELIDRLRRRMYGPAAILLSPAGNDENRIARNPKEADLAA